MNYTAQVIYTDFIEIFDVSIEEDNLHINLKEVSHKKEDKDGVLTLDLASQIREGYASFPYQSGDLVVIQVKDVIVVATHRDNEVNWFKFSVNDLVQYLFRSDITSQITPYLAEDSQIFINSLFNDLIRNDYSYSEFNKKIKFAKMSLIMSFVDAHIDFNYKRVLLDETVLGDIEIDQIGIAFRFSRQGFLKLIKIDNLSKIAVLLEKNNITPKGFQFFDHAAFINNPSKGDKIKLIFGDEGVKFDYQVLAAKNYVFDLGDKSYSMNVGNLYKEDVRGKVIVYNGDERDLMLS